MKLTKLQWINSASRVIWAPSHHTDWKQLLFLHLVIQTYILTDKHLKAARKNITL